MNKLTTKNKLRAFIILAFVLVMTAYFILVAAVLSADAANNTGARLVVVETAVVGKGSESDQGVEVGQAGKREAGGEAEEGEECMIGEGWILVTDEMDVDPVPEGYSLAGTRCGDYLIPFTASDGGYPGPGEEPYPYPEPTEVPGECIRAWDGEPCWPEE